jgi:hypothetical protein
VKKYMYSDLEEAIQMQLSVDPGGDVRKGSVDMLLAGSDFELSSYICNRLLQL